MRWTNDQLLAIETEGNLIVSAAAGAGKTAVLAERITARILAGVGVENLLVLTFTRAAASEMKGRITARLHALANECRDAEQKSRLRAQAKAVDGAHISTVHAFCARILRRHYHAVNLPASWRVADEMECAALIERVRDELLTALSVEGDASYRALLYAFGGEQQVWEAMMKTYRFTCAQPEPIAWLGEATARYGTEENKRQFLLEAVSESRREIRLIVDALEEAKALLTPHYATALAALDDDLTQYRMLLLCDAYEAYRSGLASISYKVMRFPRDAEDSLKSAIQAVRQQGKDLINAQRALFHRCGGEEMDALTRAGAVVDALNSFVKRFMSAYAEAKRDAGILDYDDLEHFALRALENEAVRRAYRERFIVIAVDEYQDSNRVQEAIVARVSRGDNLFFVGDVKQSIYRFRQAEPRLFIEKLNAFSLREKGRVDLKANFRSARAVLDAVNALFSRIMTFDACGMEYDARARLVPGADAPAGGVELHLIEKTRAFDDDVEDAADADVEGRLIASRIQAIMREERYLDTKTGEARPYRYADFAVLLRAGTHAQAYAQTLSRCGVPCYALASGGYFDALEVQALLNVLRVIDNRRQDVPLLSAASSAVGGFSFEELARVRTAHREGAFYEAFLACAEQADELGEKARAFFARLDRYQDESRLLSVEELLGLLLDETGFYEEVGAGYNGAQRQANLDALLDKARAFESGGMRGVWNFLRHIELASQSANVSAAQTVSADVVRIMTIHKSKGLEFPIVFIADLARRFDVRAAGNALQLHADEGIALRFLDGAGFARVKRDTLARQVLSKRIRFEERAEEMRVLYVAMTRARERLIMTGCLANAESRLAALPAQYVAWDARTAASPLGWLLGARPQGVKARVHQRESWLAPAAQETEAREMPAADESIRDALETALGWRYPFASASRLPAKASVSALEGDTPRRVALHTPAFIEEARDGAFAGTATHAALQRLSLRADMDCGQVEAAICALADAGAITHEQAEAADGAGVAWFTQTELFGRMARSARVERELSFSYAANANALFDTDADERVIVQGVMDACFVEGGGWVLLDYKTDRVRAGVSAAEAARRHATQLSHYAAALEQLTRMPVSEAYVVMLAYRTCVRFLA